MSMSNDMECVKYYSIDVEIRQKVETVGEILSQSVAITKVITDFGEKLNQESVQLYQSQLDTLSFDCSSSTFFPFHFP